MGLDQFVGQFAWMLSKYRPAALHTLTLASKQGTITSRIGCRAVVQLVLMRQPITFAHFYGSLQKGTEAGGDAAPPPTGQQRGSQPTGAGIRKINKNILFLVHGGDNLFFYCSFTRVVWVDVLPFESLLPKCRKCRETTSVRGTMCDGQEHFAVLFADSASVSRCSEMKRRNRAKEKVTPNPDRSRVSAQHMCLPGAAQVGSSIKRCVIPSLLSLLSQLRNLLKKKKLHAHQRPVCPPPHHTV